MQKIGYARVSTASQNLDRQIAALRAAGCEVMLREKASGKATKGRPQLEKAIDALGTGSVLVVAEWDRATRSMLDGIAIIERIHARGSFVQVLDKPAPGPHHPVRPRPDCPPECHSGGRASAHRQAIPRWPGCCEGQGRQVRAQAEAHCLSAGRGRATPRSRRECQGHRQILRDPPRDNLEAPLVPRGRGNHPWGMTPGAMLVRW